MSLVGATEDIDSTEQRFSVFSVLSVVDSPIHA
jgi:hypothetical protein